LISDWYNFYKRIEFYFPGSDTYHHQDSRAKLTAAILNWELSGNGFDQCMQEDKGFGYLEEENFLNNNRAAFLQGYHSHILYLCHLSDKEDILQQSVFRSRSQAQQQEAQG
jgi:hypothetical protein